MNKIYWKDLLTLIENGKKPEKAEIDFNNEMIDWKSMHVVKITSTIEEVDFDQFEIMKESILNKLTQDEREFVLSEDFRMNSAKK